MKEDRLDKILEIVKTQQSVDIKTLMKLFYASEATIRRDLALLEQQGLIVRSRGKAVNNQMQADLASLFTTTYFVISPSPSISNHKLKIFI